MRTHAPHSTLIGGAAASGLRDAGRAGKQAPEAGQRAVKASEGSPAAVGPQELLLARETSADLRPAWDLATQPPLLEMWVQPSHN